MRILFMGTPDFALESLKALYEANYDIVGVVTTSVVQLARCYTINLNKLHGLPMNNQYC